MSFSETTYDLNDRDSLKAWAEEFDKRRQKVHIDTLIAYVNPSTIQKLERNEIQEVKNFYSSGISNNAPRGVVGMMLGCWISPDINVKPAKMVF